jgi:hypothetical protein
MYSSVHRVNSHACLLIDADILGTPTPISLILRAGQQGMSPIHLAPISLNVRDIADVCSVDADALGKCSMTARPLLLL